MKKEARSRQQAKQFIISNLSLNHGSLACKAIGGGPCPVGNSGKALVWYAVSQAFPHSLPLTIRQNIQAEVLAEKHNPYWLWGYNKYEMIDADDTSFALQLLVYFKQPICISDLTQFYLPKQNAYLTFISSKGENTSNGHAILTFASEENNAGIHVEVNANIFNLFQSLHLENKINYSLLVKAQSPQGYWQGYFYLSKFYATYLCLKLLYEKDQYVTSVIKAMHFLHFSQHRDGSWGTPSNPYDTALAIRSLSLFGSKEKTAIAKGIRYLYALQKEDGSWSSNQPIWMYVEKDSPLHIWVAYDDNRVLTTAMVLQALVLVPQQRQS